MIVVNLRHHQAKSAVFRMPFQIFTTFGPCNFCLVLFNGDSTVEWILVLKIQSSKRVLAGAMATFLLKLFQIIHQRQNMPKSKSLFTYQSSTQPCVSCYQTQLGHIPSVTIESKSKVYTKRHEAKSTPQTPAALPTRC